MFSSPFPFLEKAFFFLSLFVFFFSASEEVSVKKRCD